MLENNILTDLKQNKILKQNSAFITTKKKKNYKNFYRVKVSQFCFVKIKIKSFY